MAGAVAGCVHGSRGHSILQPMCRRVTHVPEAMVSVDLGSVVGVDVGVRLNP